MWTIFHLIILILFFPVYGITFFRSNQKPGCQFKLPRSTIEKQRNKTYYFFILVQSTKQEEFSAIPLRAGYVSMKFINAHCLTGERSNGKPFLLHTHPCFVLRSRAQRQHEHIASAWRYPLAPWNYESRLYSDYLQYLFKYLLSQYILVSTE